MRACAHLSSSGNTGPIQDRLGSGVSHFSLPDCPCHQEQETILQKQTREISPYCDVARSLRNIDNILYASSNSFRFSTAAALFLSDVRSNRGVVYFCDGGNKTILLQEGPLLENTSLFSLFFFYFARRYGRWED
jgi:hypothetical protein